MAVPPPSALNPAATAIASTSVDLPAPLSPTRNVTLGRGLDPLHEANGWQVPWVAVGGGPIPEPDGAKEGHVTIVP